MTNRASVHATQPGSQTGLGAFLRNTYAAGNPVPVVYSVNGSLKSVLTGNSPPTKMIYRRQTDTFNRLPPNFFNDDPVVSATNWMSKTQDPSDSNRTLVQNWALNPSDWYDPLNEPVIGTVAQAQYLNTWMLTALDIAHANNFKLALFSFSTGSPQMDLWQYLYPALRKGAAQGAILSLHEYSVNNSMQNADPGNVLRYRDVYNILPADCKMPIVISECGAGNGYNTGLSGQAWVNDLMWYNAQTCQDDYLLGFCAYQLGGSESNLVDTLPAYATAISGFTCVTTPPPPAETSIDGDFATSHGMLIDAHNDDWMLGSTRSEAGYAVLKNGIWFADGYAVALLYHHEQVYVTNDFAQWFKITPTGYEEILDDPRLTEQPPPPDVKPFRLQPPITDIPWRVTDVFDAPRTYANGKHEGIDIDCYDDTTAKTVPVRAAHDGLVEKVVTIYSGTGYGRYVILSHDWQGETYKTWYCHMASCSVVVGQVMRAGDQVGIGGNSGTTAIHLHFNLQHMGHGLSGYYVPDVVDPLPYIDVAPTTPPVALGPVAIQSVHGRADGGMLRSVDVQAAKTARLNGYKLYQNSRDDYNTLKVNGFLIQNVIVRLDHIKDRKVNADAYLNSANTGIWDLPLLEAANGGVIWIEMFNEVNLSVEGNGIAWATPLEFCALFNAVLSRAKAKFPALKFISPALSPQANTPDWWNAFNAQGVFAACDGLGAHAYWDSEHGAYPMDSETGGRHYRGLFPYLTSGKKVHITEASNNQAIDSDVLKGQQYARYLTTMETDKVARVDFFCMSASDATFNNRRETWVRDTTMSAIPAEVAKR